MELWIRSQNRKVLVKCNDIAVIESENHWEIVGYFDKETEYEILGVYSSEDRSISILNEITKCITKNFIVNGLGQAVAQSNVFIFEMPKE